VGAVENGWGISSMSMTRGRKKREQRQVQAQDKGTHALGRRLKKKPGETVFGGEERFGMRWPRLCHGAGDLKPEGKSGRRGGG